MCYLCDTPPVQKDGLFRKCLQPHEWRKKRLVVRLLFNEATPRAKAVSRRRLPDCRKIRAVELPGSTRGEKKHRHERPTQVGLGPIEKAASGIHIKEACAASGCAQPPRVKKWLLYHTPSTTGSCFSAPCCLAWWSVPSEPTH